MKTLYTQKEVSEIFSDVLNKTLIYWARQKFVEWAEEVEDGRGINRKYSFYNLYQIAVVRELAGNGVPSSHIRYIMDKHFKDYVESSPLVPESAGFREIKPSKSNVMEKYLIIPKIVLLRRFGRTPSKDVQLCNPESLCESLEFLKDSSSIQVINLPLIIRFVQGQIEKLDHK
jgi:DNA-binding transcriptional MerR regulator